MNCLSDQNIQEYIDRELPEAEMAQMDKHLKDCQSCKDKLAKQAKFITTLRNDFNAESPNITVPSFQYPDAQIRQNKTRVRKLIWPAAAAVIIFFLFIYSPEKERRSGNIQEAYILDIDYEIDANKPWDAQEINFRITEQYLE